MYSFITNLFAMEMCHGLASFLHTWHMHETNTCVVRKQLHPDVQYLATVTISSQNKQNAPLAGSYNY